MFSNLTVAQLKKELSQRGARLTGRKNDLIERLESYDRNENYCNPPVILPPTVLPNWPDSGFRQILPAHRSCLPKLLEGHITGYFRYRSACDDQANGDITALEKGKILFEANRVHTCSFCSTDSDTFFSGIVRAMMKKKVTYSVRLKLNTSGEVVNSDCECPAGAGPHSTCKHVAALAFALGTFVAEGKLFLHQSCTERLQTFHMPVNPYGGSPVKVENLPRKRSLDHSLDDPRPMKYRNLPGYNDYVRNATVNYVAATGHDLTIRYIYPVANLRAAVLDHDYCYLPITEYWVQESTKVTREQISSIERATRSQSGSRTWFEQRQMRLTASTFGDVCHRTVRRNNDKLCAALYNPRALRTKAIIHGKTHEADAIKSFCLKTGLKVDKCGLFIYADEPYLAATPDGLVGNNYVLEVKCPYAGRDQSISPGRAFPFLETRDRKLCLKITHKYFDQIQGQMAITGRSYAYFVVFTFVDTAVIKVPFEADFWQDSMLAKLKSFYECCYRSYVAKQLTK